MGTHLNRARAAMVRAGVAVAIAAAVIAGAPAVAGAQDGTAATGAVITAEVTAPTAGPGTPGLEGGSDTGTSSDPEPVAAPDSDENDGDSSTSADTGTPTVETSNSNGSTTTSVDPPSNISLPTIGGLAAVGSTLTATDGTWDGTGPFTFDYQWQRCDLTGGSCAPIAGATNPTYVPGSVDVDATLRVAVHAVGLGGDTIATSNATAAVATTPVNVDAPTVSGTGAAGSPLNGTVGTWSGTTPLVYNYQWEHCDYTDNNCTNISGANTATYTPTTNDISTNVRVRITALNVAGNASAVSNSVRVRPGPPSVVAAPSIAGTAAVGSTLNGDPGRWLTTGAPTYMFSWQRCDAAGGNCAAITGAVGYTYTPVPADAGHSIKLSITTSDAIGDTTAAVTAPAGLDVNQSAVTAGGTLTVTGSGYRPGSTVNIHLHSTPMFLASATVGIDGTFQATVHIGTGVTPGAHHIVVTGTGIDGAALTQSTPLTVTGAAPADTTDGGGAGATGSSGPSGVTAATAELARTGMSSTSLVATAVLLMLIGAVLCWAASKSSTAPQPVRVPVQERRRRNTRKGPA